MDNVTGQTMPIRMGETVLVPASAEVISIVPESNVRLLEVFA